MKNKICGIFGLAAFVIAPLFAGAAIDLNEIKPDGFARGVVFTVAGYTNANGTARTALTDFPVLVRISEDISGFDYDDVYSHVDNGHTIPHLAFTDAEGNKLAYDVDTWNNSSTSLVWVTLPTMIKGTEFAMFWRATEAAANAAAGGNAFTNYVGVWHLNEPGDGRLTISDSTTNALVATSSDMSAAQPAGVIGAARRITTDTTHAKADKAIKVDTAKKAIVDTLGTDFAVSFWQCPRLVFQDDNKAGMKFTGLLTRKSGGKTDAWGLQLGDSLRNLRIFNQGDNKKIETTAISPDTFDKDKWLKMDVVYRYTTSANKGTFEYYVNGELFQSGNLESSKAAKQGTETLAIGGFTSANERPYSGDMDEVRVGRHLPTADWVKASYVQETTGSFLASSAVVAFEEAPVPVAAFSLSDKGAAFARFTASVSSCGGDATECAIFGKCWKSSDGEPANWSLLATGVAEGVSTNVTIIGLDSQCEYTYKLKAVNNLAEPEDSEIASGTFPTSGVGDPGEGGLISRIGDDYVHTFGIVATSDGGATDTYEFTPPSYANTVRTLVVAGGGAGGYYGGGGGGAGGLRHFPALPVEGGTTYTVKVGAGGVASSSATVYGGNGGDSLITSAGGTVTNAIAVGGGAGANGPLNNQTACLSGKSGGSGGGSGKNGGNSYPPGSGTTGQGNAGGSGMQDSKMTAGGGGGGAGAAGGSIDTAGEARPAGSGGEGLPFDISGTEVYYAGGGGGGGSKSRNATSGAYGSGGTGGIGGGGSGGMETDNASSLISTAGVDGLGGGGGGGSQIDGYREGKNGGSGVVIVRYPVEGDGQTMTRPAISLQSATCNEETFQGEVTFRVAWAGCGQDYANVKAVWGYSANALNRTNDLATGVIGVGSGAFQLKSDERTVYVRLLVVNAAGASALSPETLSFYVNDNPKADEEEVLPTASGVAISRVDGAYATVTGLVTSAGMSSSILSNCTVRAHWGTTAGSLDYNTEATFRVGAFALNMDGLFPNMTYYWDVELQDDDGNVVAAAAGDSFTTLGASAVGTVTSSADQQTFTVTVPLVSLGAGTTYVLVRWSEDNGETWGEFVTAGTRTATDVPGNVKSPNYRRSSWGSVKYECVISNECVTSAGVPNGVAWSSTQTGTIDPVDKANYTWQAVDGEWNGNWNDTAHWANNKNGDCLGYPQTSDATASFLSCTHANPVTVNVNGKYTVKKINFFDAEPADLSFVGTGTNTSSLTTIDENTIMNEYMQDGSRLLVKDLKFNGNNKELKLAQKESNTATNVAVVFSGAAVENVKALWFRVNESSLTFCDGSTVVLTEKLSVGGTNTVITIDNSTVTTPSVYAGDNRASTGLKLCFVGADPSLAVSVNFQTYDRADTICLEFAVPVGGYASAPLVKTGSAFATAIDKKTPGYFKFAVSEDSPALKRSREVLSNVVIVQTENGFATDYIADGIGVVPTHNEVSCGEFKWGLEGSPLEGESPDLTTARQILLDLQGKSNGVLFLIY